MYGEFREEPERKEAMREKKRRENNSGFTLVEVLVAVAILAIVSIPVIQSFVSVAQVNSKSRRRLSATTIAENLMESCKGMTLKEFAAQCDGVVTPLTIIDSGDAREVPFDLNTTTPVSNTVSPASAGYKFNAKGDGKYAFCIQNIISGNAKYDAVIKYERDKTRSKGADGGSVETTLRAAEINVLQFYKVTISVYRAANDIDTLSTAEAIVTIEGSVADSSR